MMNRNQHKDYLSESGFKYDFTVTKKRDEIFIYQKDRGFVFSIQNGKIDWEQHKENTVLLSDDVINAANEFAKYCHLIVFS